MVPTKQYLEKIIETQKASENKGRIATYIPELSKANIDHLGITMMDIEGQSVVAGDDQTKFTLQSISKIITLMLAIEDHGEDYVFSKVGTEAVEYPFNTLRPFEKKPNNPMMNAGAIVVSSLIKGINTQEKIERVLKFTQRVTENPNIQINTSVFESEKRTSSRNRAIAYYLDDLGLLEDHPLETLDVYFSQCSIEVNTGDLARLGANLANWGKDVLTNEQIIPTRITEVTKTLMAVCGMYDESGRFQMEVGIPSKSGVSGGILSVVPGNVGIGIYSPGLDPSGNSFLGKNVLEVLSKSFRYNIYSY